MARVVTPAQAKELGLPGRRSLEIVSGETGSRAVTLRLVEIAVPRSGDKPRGRHFHSDTEECIYVLSGRGCTESESGDHMLKAGDTILIPPGEQHVTRNTGNEPLMLLCFFPTARVTNRTPTSANEK
jgi:quercetin dioxygenase-like cupin family protein